MCLGQEGSCLHAMWLTLGRISSAFAAGLGVGVVIHPFCKKGPGITLEIFLKISNAIPDAF